MNFDLTQDQKMIVETASAFVRKESPITRLRALREDPLGYSREIWKRMGDLGWLGISLPESVGGFGGTFVDAALILEQLGTTLVPEPYIASVCLAGTALLGAGSAVQAEKWLAPVASGDTTLALACTERESRFDPLRVATRAEKKGSKYQLNGEKIFVLNGHAADSLVVSARTSGNVADRTGVSLFVVDPKAKGVMVRPVKTMDGQRAAMVTFEGAEVDADRLLGAEGGAAKALEKALDHGAAAACAEGVGIMQTVLGMTREYLCVREQFGVKIGTFQALQHRCVDMFVETELARSMSILASIKADDADEVERQTGISAAKVQLAVSGRFVTQNAIQLFGGIGITDEHDVGLFFKRMHILNTICGDEEYHLARFASLPSFTVGVAAAS